MRSVKAIIADIEAVDEQIEAVRRALVIEQREPLRKELQEAYTTLALENYGIAPGDALLPTTEYVEWVKSYLADNPYSLADYLRDLKANEIVYVGVIENVETCVVRMSGAFSTPRVPLGIVSRMREAYVAETKKPQ